MFREKVYFDAIRMQNNLTASRSLSGLILLTLFGVLVVSEPVGALESSHPEKRFLARSSVVVTQPLFQDLQDPDRGRYGRYEADILMWGFTPSSFPDFSMKNFDAVQSQYGEGVKAHQDAGIKWVSRVEWDVIWRGMTQKFPETYQHAFTRRLDGSPLPITWFPGHYFFSTHAPQFQRYLKWQIKNVAMGGLAQGRQLDALLFDSQHATPAHYNQGGDFSDACMDNFSRWLGHKFSDEERINLGLPVGEGFHYGQYLLGLGWTRESYEQESDHYPNAIPLSSLFRQFLTEWNNSHVEQLVHFADETARLSGYPQIPGSGYIRVGSSSQLLDPFWKGLRFIHTDVIDFYVQEFNHHPESHVLNGKALLMYKLAEVLGKPLALTAQPYPDWNYMVDHPDAVDLVRRWIAQAYANGALLMVPEKMWAYNRDKEQRYYNARAGDYDFIYRWIGDNRRLFDGYETRANVGLVYDFGAYIENEFQDLEVLAMAEFLVKRNTPFHLLVAGNEAWPKYLHDSDQLNRIEELDFLVTSKLEHSKIDDAQRNILSEQGRKTLSWPLLDSENDNRLPNVDVSARKVYAFPREKRSDKRAPKVIHFVNHDFHALAKKTRPKWGVGVEIDKRLFDREFSAAIYHQPGKPALKLTMTRVDGAYRLILPVIESWGLLELSIVPVANPH